MNIILIYITHKNLKEAKKVAAVLLEKRLVACVNYFLIESASWWQGKIESGKEVVSILKTSKKNWKKVQTAVKKIHPYDLPCIMKIDVEASREYADWINEETKSTGNQHHIFLAD